MPKKDNVKVGLGEQEEASSRTHVGASLCVTDRGRCCADSRCGQKSAF